MNIKKTIQFKFTDTRGIVTEVREYTILFGDFVLVKWSDSGSPYWSTRERAISEMPRDRNAKIIDQGTIYVEETGGYFRNEKEFIQTMRLLRASPL